MKKFLVIFSIFFTSYILYTAPPVEIVNSSRTPVNVKVVSQEVQPEGIDIYNFTVSSITAVRIVNKDWNYAYFYITNYSENYQILLSTSPLFTTFYKLFPHGGSYASDVRSDIYCKVIPGGAPCFVAVLIEKK
ncbi:MAG: hypothetical protein N2Z73_03690 [Endomicrobia bacterium]|nr:hypothetical protein [Endomicrobiia bacterium]